MELVLNHLSKSYDGGKSYALNNFSKSFQSGVYGLLGPNGAGKSTLINLMTQNLSADSGNITWNGKEIYSMGKEYRTLLGYMPQQQNLYDSFTGEEFLWYMAALKGMKKKQAEERINCLLQTVNLEKTRFKRIHTYSGGMKQRLLIAQALLNDPPILIMDEPTAGLDPKERIRIRNFISEIAFGKIVILATHVISDIEFIAKEILLVREGELIQQGSPKQLLQKLEGFVWNVYLKEEQLRKYEEEGMKIVNLTYAGDEICARMLSEKKLTQGRVEAIQPTLEDVYLYYEN